MKAIKTINKTDLNRMKEAAFNDFYTVMQENKALDIIAVARCFGIGKKRMQKFLSALCEVREDFDTWKKDDVFSEKLTAELSGLGIDINWLMGDNVRLCDFRDKHPESKMSENEAGEIINKVDMYREFMGVNNG